ncbi:MAG: hypothetical protein WB443_01525 [Nitrososphaeraceae archaeon]
MSTLSLSEDMPKSSSSFTNWVKGLNQQQQVSYSAPNPVTRGEIIVDIVVRQIVGEESYDSRILKRYLHTTIMAARIPPPTLEEIRANIASSYPSNRPMTASSERLSLYVLF